MNRRRFLQTSAVMPLFPVNRPIQPMRTLRAQFLMTGDVAVQMTVTAHASAKLAEQWREGWEERAFEGEGEWYLQSSDVVDLPDHLATMPGTLMYHEFVIGVAAAERSLLVGAFRREYIACVIRVMGNHEPEMIWLAEWCANQELPERWELMWSSAQLQGFVPTTESAGVPITPSDHFWP